MDTRPLRLALVCDYSLSYLGGAQSAFVDEVAILRARGHEVTVIAPADGRSAVDEAAPASVGAALRIRARGTIPGVQLPLIRNSAALRRRLRAFVHEHGIDVIHVHSEFGLSAAALQVAAEEGIPVVHTVHTFFWQGPRLGVAGPAVAAAIRLFARWLRGTSTSSRRLAPQPVDSALRALTLTAAQAARVVISPSAHQAALLRDADLPRVRVVPNAVPSSNVGAAPLSQVDAPLRIAWVGRLTPEKRIMPFIDAVLLALGRLGDGALDVTIVGEGPQRAEAEQRVAASAIGPRAIRFVGRLDREDVRRTMRQAHLVALTSHGFDNQPVTVVEALTEARSVLYVDPALKEGLADGGILSASPDPEGIAATLVDLVRDPQRVIASSRRALAAAVQFSPESHADALQSIYREALTASEAATPA